MNKKKVCIWSSVLIAILVIAAAVTVTLVLVLRKHEKHAPSLDTVISDNSTFPNGSYTIPVDSLKSGLPEQAPLFVDISMLNELGLRVDNSSLVAETNRLSYFFVRLPPDNTTNLRNKRQLEDDGKGIGVRFGNSDKIHVIPLELSTTKNSGLSLIGEMSDNSQVYQLEVRMGNAMCANADDGTCLLVDWTPYFVSNENTASKAGFSDELPVACGSQCNADANSACATSCSMCDGQQVAGADTPVTRRYKMNKTSATDLQFVYETFQVKDRIVVSYEGQHIFDSDCVGTNGEKKAPINYKGKSVEVRVDVEPNCEGTTGTAWYFTLPCDDCEKCKKYKCLDDSLAHCGPKGYLIDYALYFCNRYYDYYSGFDASGQNFIDCVRPRLLDFLENYLKGLNGKVNCVDVRKKAFDSHVQIYIDCGICNAFLTNPWKFVEVLYTLAGPKFSLDAWRQVVEMLPQCGPTYHQDLCKLFPLLPEICMTSICDEFPNIPCVCSECNCNNYPDIKSCVCDQFLDIPCLCKDCI